MELWIALLYLVLCSLLFLGTYWQLWMLLYYKQKRLSYQSLCLFTCLLWAAFRIVLFSFYIKNGALTRDLHPLLSWLLHGLPVCLQYFSLCLLNAYLARVIIKASCSPENNTYKTDYSSIEKENKRKYFGDLKMGISGNLAVAIGTIVGILYILRSCCNVVSLYISPGNKSSPFSYGWNGFSDCIPEDIDVLEYLIFGITLFCCEVLPMFLMVYFFRAKNMNQYLGTAGMVNSHSFGSRTYFFDNPRRYDSDDDLPRLAATRSERGSLPSIAKPPASYGAICPISSPMNGPSSGVPILFMCGGKPQA
ncbi:integral membrane protein GPR137C [Rhinophrynus dorsalis]